MCGSEFFHCLLRQVIFLDGFLCEIMLIHSLHRLTNPIRIPQHQCTSLLQWLSHPSLMGNLLLRKLSRICWYHRHIVIPQHNCIMTLLSVDVTIAINLLLSLIVRVVFLIAWLEIRPLLLLKVMIMCSHLYLTFLLGSWCLLVQWFTIVKDLVWCCDRLRVVVP